MKQRSFSEISTHPAFKSHRVFGGDLNKGKRKTSRPISTRKWMHLTLKASSAKGRLSLLNIKHRLQIEKLIRKEAKKNFITMGDGVNMGNHLHLKIRCQTREGFQRFLRIISGRIAMLVTGAKKGKSFGKRFWDELCYSRVLTSDLEVLQLMGYFEANRCERRYGRQARERHLQDFNDWISSLRRNTS